MQTIFMQKKIAKNKKAKDLQIVIFLMASLSLIFILIGTLAFFSSSKNTTGKITLGELDFTIVEDTSTFSNVLPSETIAKVVSIKNSRDENGSDIRNLVPFLFRFDCEFYVDNVLDENLTNKISLNNYDNFTFYNSKYYYNAILKTSEIQPLFSSITFSYLIDNSYQNKNLRLIINVDAIQATKGAYQEIWSDAPNA